MTDQKGALTRHPGLATFVDRYTMRHVRVYPHPVDRVWDALTDDTQMSKWFGFAVRFEDGLRVGGRCEWGPADNVFYETTITELDPKTLIVHTNDDGTQRFELAEHPDGCRFDYVQHFYPKELYEPDTSGMPGTDQPAGPDTPWRPHFCGGFHAIWDNLGNHLDGAPLERGQEPSDGRVAQVVDQWLSRQTGFEGMTDETAADYRRQLLGVGRWLDLIEIYRAHIRDTIPEA